MQHEARIGCTDLAGHEHHLIVVEDPVGQVVVFPPGAWAVLGQPQVQQLCAELVMPAEDGKGSDGHR